MVKYNYEKKYTNGFSLIEIMIALALLAGVSLFLVKISKRGLDVKTTVNSNFEIGQFYNHIGKLILSKETCELNFGGPGNSVTPNSPYNPKSFNVSKIDFRVPNSPPTPPTSAGVVLYKADGITKYGAGSFYITSMTIEEDSPSNYAFYVTIKRANKDAAGGRDLKKRFPLAVKLNSAGDQIISCHQTQDEQAEIVCNSIEGYTWNGSLKKCEKDSNPITITEFRFTNTGNSTISNQQFCSLNNVRFGDKYKDSSTQECDLRKIGTDTWLLQRYKSEARDLHCGVSCFNTN